MSSSQVNSSVLKRSKAWESSEKISVCTRQKVVRGEGGMGGEIEGGDKGGERGEGRRER